MFLYSNNLFAFMKSKTLVEFGGLYYIYMYIMRCIIGTNWGRQRQRNRSYNLHPPWL